MYLDLRSSPMLLKPEAFFRKKAAVEPIIVMTIKREKSKTLIIIATADQYSSGKNYPDTYQSHYPDILVQYKMR